MKEEKFTYKRKGSGKEVWELEDKETGDEEKRPIENEKQLVGLETKFGVYVHIKKKKSETKIRETKKMGRERRRKYGQERTNDV